MQTILIPFRDDEASDHALAAALAVARQHGSYIEAMHAHGPTQFITGDGIALPPVYVTQLNEQGRTQAAQARGRFEAGVKAAGLALNGIGESGTPSAGWVELDGLESQVVGDYGRSFDLIVVARVGERSHVDWRSTCEAALFESGRPVLLAGGSPGDTFGQQVLIAWNGSTETARTIAMAKRMLLRAGTVEVLTVQGGVVPGPSGEMVARNLNRNGISATARTVEPGRRTVGEAILEEAHAIGADLILKGAYTQSRFRQMIFGGATDHLLNASELPVLLAH